MINETTARRIDTAGHPLPTQEELEDELYALTWGRLTGLKLAWMMSGAAIATVCFLAGLMLTH